MKCVGSEVCGEMLLKFWMSVNRRYYRHQMMQLFEIVAGWPARLREIWMERFSIFNILWDIQMMAMRLKKENNGFQNYKKAIILLHPKYWNLLSE